MTPEDFERLQALMASRAGYRLGRDRMQLANHRLGPVARREGFDNVDDLLAALWSKPVASQAWAVIEHAHRLSLKSSELGLANSRWRWMCRHCDDDGACEHASFP